MRFEWDPAKDEANRRKHGLGFDEAKQLFVSGADYLEIPDERYSGVEERFLAVGPIERGVVLVVWTERADDVIRLISARFATRGEIERYRNYMDSER